MSLLTGSDGENIHAEKEGNLGTAVIQEFLGTTGNNEDVTDATDNNAPEDHVVTSGPGVCKVSDDKGKTVGE